MNPNSGRGFSLLEIMMVVACSMLLMGPLFQIFRAGSRTSIKGMAKMDTILEGRRVLQQMELDLKNMCFLYPNDREINLSSLLHGNGRTFFSFHAFPHHGEVDAVTSARTTSGVAPRLASRITYLLEEVGQVPVQLFRLVREEVYHPDHPLAATLPKNTRRTILSAKVGFLDMGIFLMHLPGGRKIPMCKTFIQLLDISPEAKGSLSPLGVPGTTGVHRASFARLVSPDFVRRFWDHHEQRPNWHSVVTPPPGP